jgi:adenylate cyclase
VTPALLVVDDSEDNRYTLTRLLGREGYTDVTTADDGQQAMARLRERRFDLVLLDIMMPEMNGYEVLEAVRADALLRHIPIIVISAVDQTDSVVRCVQLGADDYLTKPFNSVLLRARIAASLDRKQLHDELAELNRTLKQRVQDQVSQIERLGRLRRVVSPHLAELIVAGETDDPLETHRRQITVAAVDLLGFTALAETAEPEEVMSVLREFHAEMGALILTHEGTLERFTGDGMMVFFNDPAPVPNPAERAIRMALAMRDRVAVLATRWAKLGYTLALRVGIAHGYATLGAIGFEGRWDYGAVGTVTGLAARLCAEAEGGQVLVTSRVANAVEGLIEQRDVGALALRDFLKPVPTVHVLGLRA